MMENQDISTLREIIKTLHTLCHMKFPGLIRLAALPGRGIKFTMQSLNISGNPSMTLGEISQKGLDLLQAKATVQLEITGLRQRLKFDCMIISVGDGQIQVTIPENLSVEERRVSARYQTAPHQCAFVSVTDFAFDAENILHPPTFSLHQKFGNWLMARNISQTGVLVEAIFPAVFNQIGVEKKNFRAEIVLAGQVPLEIICETRWSKRIRETIEELEHGEPRIQHKYHIGCRFVDPGEQLEVAIAAFINQLNVSSAI